MTNQRETRPKASADSQLSVHRREEWEIPGPDQNSKRAKKSAKGAHGERGEAAQCPGKLIPSTQRKGRIWIPHQEEKTLQLPLSNLPNISSSKKMGPKKEEALSGRSRNINAVGRSSAYRTAQLSEKKESKKKRERQSSPAPANSQGEGESCEKRTQQPILQRLRLNPQSRGRRARRTDLQRGEDGEIPKEKLRGIPTSKGTGPASTGGPPGNTRAGRRNQLVETGVYHFS